jgi:hypothetical protein
VALTTAQVAGLTTATLGALSTAQVAALETADIAALKTSQLAGMTSANVAALTTAQVVALTTAQVAGLTTATLAALSTAQVAALETADIAALKTAQVSSLTTTYVAALTTAQLTALTSAQICALTSSQKNALTTAQFQALKPSTPIILDLNDDGVKTLSVSAGVKFDMFAEGKNVNTGWVSSGDGLLVMDRNHDGQINDGSELFGSSTTLSNGQKAADGYSALREMDANHDNVIDQNDAAFNDLRVWVDGNSDGVTETGELKTLASLGITQIGVQTAVGTEADNGNVLGLTSTYQTADGATHAAADVWFATDSGGSGNQAAVAGNGVDAAIAALGSTDAAASQLAVAKVAIDVPVTGSSVVPSMGQQVDLRTRVSSLAQAMGSFGGSSTPDVVAGGLNQSLSSGGGAEVSSGMLAVASMADAMKQFDSNGNMVANVVNTSVPSTKSLTLPGVPEAGNLFSANGTHHS